MITKTTVLILGAGASADYNFPLGRDLIRSICSELFQGESSLLSLLLHCGFQSQHIKVFAHDLWESNLQSIDAFLENRAEFAGVGKASIAGMLIPIEREEQLSRNGWYEYLHPRLIGRRSEFQDNKLTVVTFNYERSFEYALLLALRGSYGLTEPECADIIQAIPIIHVYGKLGEPDYLLSEQKTGRPYRPDVNPDIIMKCVDTIKIVHEGSENTPEFLEAQKAINRAEVVCCLGFGYHPDNVRRLLLDKLTPTPNQKKVFFSTFGFSDRQKEMLIQRLAPNGWGTIDRKFGTKDQGVRTFLEETAALELG